MSDYNLRAIERGLWILSDLPDFFPGKAILQAADDRGNDDDKVQAAELTEADVKAFGEAVFEFQAAAGLRADGCLGPKTLRAMNENKPLAVGVLAIVGGVRFRRPIEASCPPERLITDGPQAARTRWNLYGGAIVEQARRLQLDPKAALAVFAVEAPGGAHGLAGLTTIRVEQTPWPNRGWGKRWSNNSRKGEQVFRAAFGGGQAGEWRGLADLAAAKGAEFACSKTSWGLPQTMGFNAYKIGYDTAVEMALAYQLSARAQVEGFFKTVVAFGLVRAVQKQDWRAFAAAYNGTGQVAHYAGAIGGAMNALVDMDLGVL